MITKEFIEKNKTENLKKGDKVVMHSCFESNIHEYKGVLWTCQTDSFLDNSKDEVVFLENFSGYFLTKYLQIVKL